MRTFRADLHVHTLLSPCAGVEMIPPLIVEGALEKGINLIAVTDHNASGNVSAVMRAAENTGLAVLPGMELQTREEVHLLCIFDNCLQLAEWQAVVDRLLPETPNPEDILGEQFLVDETGEFIGREKRLLLNSVAIGLEDAAGRVRALGGLAIPAHIDRKSNGLMEVLGLLPEGFDVLEISRHITPEQARQRYQQIARMPLVQNGDVHFLDGFLGATEFMIEAPRVAELNMAIRGEQGRGLNLRKL